MRALIVVDVQKDFLPGGALAIDEGDQVVPLIEAMAHEYELVVTTQDWHPDRTVHFDRWPVHCVRGTNGAMFGLDIRHLRDSHGERPWRVLKGEGDADDGYSGFEGRVIGTGSAPLADFLRAKGVTEAIVVGLALDYCVRATALDAQRLGFDTTVLLEATRPVDETAGGKTIDELEEAGVVCE